MPESLMLTSRAGAVLLALLGLGCGSETEPHPGYADPCTTPMSGVLGCPASSQIMPAGNLEEACRKLVQCGVLADTNMSSSGEACGSADECKRDPDGACLNNSQGEPRCHYHYLDYLWCVVRLSEPGSDPCDSSQRYSGFHVASSIRCIGDTSCNALGGSYQYKVAPPSPTDENPNPEDPDKYQCKANPGTTIRTATICDYGLLYYARHTP